MHHRNMFALELWKLKQTRHYSTLRCCIFQARTIIPYYFMGKYRFSGEKKKDAHACLT